MVTDLNIIKKLKVVWTPPSIVIGLLPHDTGSQLRELYKMSINCSCKFENKLKAIHFLFYATLSIVTYFFVSRAVKEYLEGRTTFSISKRPLTVDDMPTITICFQTSRKLEFGKDIRIQGYIPHTESVVTPGLFFARFLGGNLRHFASITLSFFQILEFFGKYLEFFENFLKTNEKFFVS